jgi:hypothetical protein
MHMYIRGPKYKDHAYVFWLNHICTRTVSYIKDGACVCLLDHVYVHMVPYLRTTCILDYWIHVYGHIYHRKASFAQNRGILGIISTKRTVTTHQLPNTGNYA